MDTLAFVVVMAVVVALFAAMEVLRRRDEREFARLQRTWRTRRRLAQEDWAAKTMPLPKLDPTRLSAPRHIAKIAS